MMEQNTGNKHLGLDKMQAMLFTFYFTLSTFYTVPCMLEELQLFMKTNNKFAIIHILFQYLTLRI